MCGMKGQKSKPAELEQKGFFKKIIEGNTSNLGKEQLGEDTEWQTDKRGIYSVVP